MTTRITLRLDLDGNRRLRPGKIALLEAIQERGSIAAAGRDFRMSYWRAWLLVDELNRMYSAPLVEEHEGGRHGGGAALTGLGRLIIALYREAERKMNVSAISEIERIEAALALSRLEPEPPG